MLYHCLFLHLIMDVPPDRRLWDLACDAAVQRILQNEKRERDPMKIYQVLRSPEELGNSETVKSLRLQPWIIAHEMLGPEDKGLTPAEQKGVHGVIGEQVWYDTKTDTLRRIETCIGLNFDQFTRAVLLAQSEFSAFLKADDNDRGALLEKLTDTGIYSRQSKLVIKMNISYYRNRTLRNYFP